MENKKDKKKVKNEKAKNIIWKVVHGISYVMSGCFIAVCCFACANQGKNNKPRNNDVVLKQEEKDLKPLPKYIQYDDTDIWFNSNDLTLDYSYLIEYFGSSNDDTGIEDTYFQYDDEDNSVSYYWAFDEFASDDYISWVDVDNSSDIRYILDNSSDDYGHFVVSSFTYIFTDELPLLWRFDGVQTDLYDEVVSAIQSHQSNINGGIFETLTESVVDFVDVLGQGLDDMVSIVYNTTTNKLTVIGTLMSIVVAVSLGYFLFRLISSYIRLRG